MNPRAYQVANVEQHKHKSYNPDMVKKKYQTQIHTILKQHLPKNAKFFIFGSSIKDKDFNDIDVAIQNTNITEKSLREAKEALETSTIPYKIDLVDFKKTAKGFQKEVLNDKILWLT